MEDEKKEFPNMELKFVNEPSEEQIKEMVRKRNEVLKQMGYIFDEDGKFNKPQKEETIYFRLTSRLVIKIIPKELTAYRFNQESKEWQKDSVLFSEYEYGNLEGEEFKTTENFPYGEPFQYGRHI